jgi:hypothetical protein
MRGPAPKDPKLRQRRNKVSTAATLREIEPSERKRTPSLPKRSDGQAWHPVSRLWWRSVWQSPMAAEYLDADVKGRLYRLAILVDRFWWRPSIALDAQICRNEAALGLSPIDRRRLQWEVEKIEDIQRNRRPVQTSQPVGADDPRANLWVV